MSALTREQVRQLKEFGLAFIPRQNPAETGDKSSEGKVLPTTKEEDKTMDQQPQTHENNTPKPSTAEYGDDLLSQQRQIATSTTQLTAQFDRANSLQTQAIKLGVVAVVGFGVGVGAGLTVHYITRPKAMKVPGK